MGRVDGEGAEHVVLFVKLVPGKTLTPQLVQKLKETIKGKLSPRHVPSEVVAVSGVPVNVNNKKLEKLVFNSVSLPFFCPIPSLKVRSELLR